jgi:hypothetical protein
MDQLELPGVEDVAEMIPGADVLGGAAELLGGLDIGAFGFGKKKKK